MVRINSGKQESGRSFCIDLYRKRSTITNIKNKLTNLCGNGLWQNDVQDTVCEVKSGMQDTRKDQQPQRRLYAARLAGTLHQNLNPLRVSPKPKSLDPDPKAKIPKFEPNALNPIILTLNYALIPEP